MIRLGIIGTNYGLGVQLPAFRADARCAVVALCGSNLARTKESAAAVGIAKAYDDWHALLSDNEIDAVAIAIPPKLQPEIAIAAIAAGKPVFAEKPLAGDLAGARAMLDAAEQSDLPTGIDFNFTQIVAWQRAKAMLDKGRIGRLHFVAVHWHFESQSTQLRVRNWKTAGHNEGGGVLGNFVSHCFHYLEWFGGRITGLQASIAGLPDEPDLQTTVMMALKYETGAKASLSMSCASYRGNGHRIEFFGEDGTLVLENRNADYMRGFELTCARSLGDFEHVPVNDPIAAQYPDGRIAPVSRLAKQFLDAIENAPHFKRNTAPGFAEGYRVQFLIDAAQRAHREGRWIDLAANSARGHE